MMNLDCRSLIIAFILMLEYDLSAANACFGISCKDEKSLRKAIEEPFENRETGKIFFHSFSPEQKLDWAHYQSKGEKKAIQKGIQPTDHNYNTMMLSISKDLKRPHRALYRSRSRNEEIWNQNQGTQHVQELAQKLKKEKTVIDRIKNLLPHKTNNYQRINQSNSNSNHLTSPANLERSKGKLPMHNDLNEQLREGTHSPNARKKVQDWLSDIPKHPDAVIEKGTTSPHHEGHSSSSSHTKYHSSPLNRESIDSTHSHSQSSPSYSRTQSHISHSIVSHADVPVTSLHIPKQTTHSRKSSSS